VEESGVNADLHDLSGLGVDETTELRLTLEMEHFDPDTLIWAAKDARWETVERDGDRATVQIETGATEIQHIQGRHTGFGSAERPTGRPGAATRRTRDTAQWSTSGSSTPPSYRPSPGVA